MDGTFIKNRRKSMGILQKDMAKSLNVSIRTYKRWEDGNLNVDDLILLGSKLNFVVQIVPNECAISAK